MENADDEIDTAEDKVEPAEDNFEPYAISETPWGSTITRIDSNVVMKTSPRCHRGEFAAMRYVAEHAPSVPIPTVHFAQWDLPGGHGRIIMDYVPDKTLHAVWPTLPSERKERVCRDTWEIIQRFRTISRPEGLPSLYITVDGSELYQPPFTGYSNEAVPLIESDEDCRQILVRNYVERNGLSYSDGQEVLDKFPRSTASVFTHGDIKPKNIIVDEEGKILTLLDWEMAGFLPEYWESVGMLSRVLEDQVEWAEVMKSTQPRNWDFDVTWVTKARRVLL